jgi:integrase
MESEKNQSVYEFPEDPKVKILVKERKGANRNLILRLLKAKRFHNSDIAKHVGISERHLRRIKNEFIEAGLLSEDDARDNGAGIVAAEFDDECDRAMGEPFSTFIQNKRKNWKPVFAFCRKTWTHIWDRPSLFLMADRTDPTGQEMCQKFLDTLGDQTTRIRDYKKKIRPFLVFIGRDDLKNKYMSMSKTRDPEGVRSVPQIEYVTFPLKLDKAISAFEEIYGIVDATKLKFKITSGLRTGEFKEHRGWTGIMKSADYKSYLTFEDGPDQFSCSVFEKMGEQWRISWIPPSIRKVLYEVWKKTPYDEPIIAKDPDKLRQAWYKVSEPILGFRLEFHDFRKVFATWLIVMEMDFTKAAKFNCGWEDLNTLDKNYNQIKGAMKKSDMEKYRENIPDWFKEELGEYM